MAERILVSFAGEGSGAGELSWGQQVVWRGIHARGAPIILTGIQPLPDGSTVQDVADDLRYLMSRHPSLRTRLLLDVGGDGHMQQVLASSGETYLEVIDTGDDADPHETARAVEAEYEFADRDYANDWPLRVAVIRHRGAPVYRVMAMDHLTSDGFGVLSMLEDLAARDRVTDAAPPVTSTEALEQARWQHTPAGERQTRRAEQHWERLLRTIPARRFPEKRDGRTPRHWQATFTSPASYLAIQVIAARTQMDTSPVLVAAFAVGLARATGVNPVVPRLYVNNRFRPGFADTVSPVAQTCPCVLDVAGITFDQAVTHAWRATVAACKSAYFAPARIRKLIEDVGQERGEEIDLALVYNDRRMDTPREVAKSLPGPEEIRAALPLTTLDWEKSDDPLDECHFHVQDSPDAVNMLAVTDTQYISPADTEGILREMETAAVAAALDPAASTGV